MGFSKCPPHHKKELSKFEKKDIRTIYLIEALKWAIIRLNRIISNRDKWVGSSFSWWIWCEKGHLRGEAGRFILIKRYRDDNWPKICNGYPNFWRHFWTPKSFIYPNLALTDFKNSKILIILVPKIFKVGHKLTDKWPRKEKK